jgi:hypothetical protein
VQQQKCRPVPRDPGEHPPLGAARCDGDRFTTLSLYVQRIMHGLWLRMIPVNVVGSGIVAAGLNRFRSSGQPCYERGLGDPVIGVIGIQKEPGGRRSERCQQQNGHDDVP